MNLSFVERAILSNQFRILGKLTSSEYETKELLYKAEILEEGYEKLYDEALSLVNNEVHSEKECQEVFDILNMYNHIDITVKELKSKEPEKYAQLRLNNTEFEGFDGNEGFQYRFLEFIVKNGKYSELEDKELNSHTASSLPKYREMLSIYNNFNRAGSYKPLLFLEIKQLMDII